MAPGGLWLCILPLLIGAGPLALLAGSWTLYHFVQAVPAGQI